MKLILTLTSPFARKVRIVMAEKKIEYEAIVDIPWEPTTHVPEFNPLGKVPVLVMDDGNTLFDSRVIVEYLDMVSPVHRLIPESVRQRIQVRRWEALADGISEAAAAIFI
jgi:glutathione S-transferase